ncbi:hypothetical protein [Sphingobium lignivorans]|uniref:Uncharacterized protein n=1 Tax=Sphingobium lignivorans TaxID=2735886 RepID=A0ABR6NFA4_9SPHN|nr:hypothetical protein [Sphingobium lignivorans]MBB5985967.1 hypothetical protein [Sphingobium lignivorans]
MILPLSNADVLSRFKPTGYIRSMIVTYDDRKADDRMPMADEIERALASNLRVMEWK